MKQKLILLRGVSGSGKSTMAQFLFDSGAVQEVWEADDYFCHYNEYKFDASKLGEAHAWCQRQARLGLRTGWNVCVSNTSTTEKEVAVYQQMAEELGVEFISLVVERRHGNDNVHNVPPEKVEQQAQRLRNNLKL